MKAALFGGVVACLILGNLALLVRGEAYLVSSTVDSDRWGKTCVYYFPARTFRVATTVGEPCPNWERPR